MNTSFYQICTLISVFSTKIIASELPYSGTIITATKNSCSKFTQDLIRKKSCIGAYTGEEDNEALRKIQGAECLFCLGISCCATAGFGAVTCAADPASAFTLGSASGCGGSIALTMITNNNDYCSITGQHSSSRNIAEDRARFFKALPELRQLIIQQQMSIAPSPIESNKNPLA